MTDVKFDSKRADWLRMLHDPSLSSECSEINQERRAEARTAYQGEVVLRWSHDFDTPIRYMISDRSEEGMRIISQIPLTEGMTGIVTRFLPDGEKVHLPMMVVWSSSTSDDEGYHCGVWFMSS